MNNKEHLAEWIDELNVWENKWHNKYLVMPLNRTTTRLIGLPSRIKFFIQRGRRGWSDEDSWAIDYWLVDNLIPMLKRLKNDSNGTPMSMFRKKDGIDKDGNPTDEASRLAEQRWDDMLGEIIYGLKCAKKIQDLDYDYKDKNKTKLLNKRVEKTFYLIGRHLFTLWD